MEQDYFLFLLEEVLLKDMLEKYLHFIICLIQEYLLIWLFYGELYMLEIIGLLHKDMVQILLQVISLDGTIIIILKQKDNLCI